MTTSADNPLESQLLVLRQQFKARLTSDYETLRALHAQVAQAQEDRQPVRDELLELRTRLHRLAGTSGTFGFVELGQEARSAERALDQALDDSDEEPDAQSVTDLLSRLNDFLKALEAETSALPDNTNTDAPASTNEAAKPPVLADNHLATAWLFEPDEELGWAIKSQIEPSGFAVRILTRTDNLQEKTAAGPDLLFVDLDALDAEETERLVPTFRQLADTMTQYDQPDTTLVAYATVDDFDNRLWAARMGASGFLVKPLDIPKAVNYLVQVFERRNANAPRVLVIEDDELLATHYVGALENAGMEARALMQPQDIMDEVAEFKPELVLMDLHMPEFQGDELAAILRQRDSWVTMPIVYLSAETDRHKQALALNRGADDFLTKPVSDQTLVLSVRARIERAREMQGLISRDGMTGLLKHSSFLEAAQSELSRARRENQCTVFVMLDIDHFKRVNDTFGHTVGDTVITSIATVLRQRLRRTDIIGRYGGEEFALVLPDCSMGDARALLDDIRQHFSEVLFTTQQEQFSCTFSAGLVNAQDYPEATSVSLIEEADKALYEAKEAGRNRVVCRGAD